MTDVFTVRLPLPPNLTNPKSTSSWRGRHFGKKDYYEVAQGTVNLAHRRWCQAHPVATPREDDVLFERAIATVELHVKRKFDATNAMALLKWPEDLLVFCHVLRNDDPTHLMYNGFPHQITHGMRHEKNESEADYNRRLFKRSQELCIVFNVRAGTASGVLSP